MKKNEKCPCHSEKHYSECCQKYHEGVPAENALVLMRSRYSAYALQLLDYIVNTTHPKKQPVNIPKWKKEIALFSLNTQFQNLKILNFIENEKEAFVTFVANLQQNGQDVSFMEKSRFEKINDRWLYCEGIVEKAL